MAYMIVRHSVEDYDAWKSVFDSAKDQREASGEQSYQILRDSGNGNGLIVVNEWDSLENARRFAASPELKEAMQRAGVIGIPEIWFLEEADRG